MKVQTGVKAGAAQATIQIAFPVALTPEAPAPATTTTTGAK